MTKAALLEQFGMSSSALIIFRIRATADVSGKLLGRIQFVYMQNKKSDATYATALDERKGNGDAMVVT